MNNMSIFFNSNKFLLKIKKIASKLIFKNKIIIQQQDAELEKVLWYMKITIKI